MGRLRASRWVAHAADRLAASLTPLERVRTLEEAFDAANGAGTPGQNLVLAERSGHIGWTIYGAIPNRVGFDGRLPASWADGWRGWNGWLDAVDYPRLIDPPGGRIWTANARVVDGDMLARLGDGSYEVGSRATIIRDRLRDARAFTAARHARHPARHARDVPGALARSDPGPSDRRTSWPATPRGSGSATSSRRTGPVRRRPTRPATG